MLIETRLRFLSFHNRPNKAIALASDSPPPWFRPAGRPRQPIAHKCPGDVSIVQPRFSPLVPFLRPSSNAETISVSQHPP